jgi:hypothetical protein
MLVFTLPNGITINTRYIEQIGPIYCNNNHKSGITHWVYQIITHRGEQLYQEFNTKEDAQLNRDRLISTIEHK